MNLEIINMPVIDYFPARLSEGKVWFISFYAMDPITNKLKRKKVRINRINPISARRKQAKKIIMDINLKLAAGWNPFESMDAPKSFEKLTDVMTIWLNEHKKGSRPDTYRTYKSYDKIFREWLAKKTNPNLYAGGFTRTMAVKICHYLYNERGLAERSFNGFLVYFNAMFNWMVRSIYIKENPFDTIKRKKPKAKKRELISLNERKLLMTWLKREGHQEFYCMVLLAYVGLIRPLEMTFLKPENFDFVNGTVYLQGKITKNGKDRVVTLTDEVVDELMELKIHKMKDSDYVFSIDFKPGSKRIDRRVISNFWARDVRPGIGLRQEVQFYSLKDSGIIQMLKDGVSPNEIRIQADHSSLAVTNEYVKHAIPEGQSTIKKKSSTFDSD